MTFAMTFSQTMPCSAVQCRLLLQAYEALAINEFHNAPVDFLFTSPLNATVLPTLRVSGELAQTLDAYAGAVQ